MDNTGWIIAFTPDKDHVYRLMDDNGKVLKSSNRRRDLVKMLESGIIPAKGRKPKSRKGE